MEHEREHHREELEDLRERADSTKEEMRRLDRLIVSSARAPRLKPSDYKTIKLRQGQFDDLDNNRLFFESRHRELLKAMMLAAKEQQHCEANRGAILAKLEGLQQTQVRLPSPR